MSQFYICTEAFSVTLSQGDAWFKVGQRIREDHEVFEGESGKNRQHRLFEPEEAQVEVVKRGPGRPRKIEVEA